MTVLVLTGGKVSKKHGRSVAVAIVDGVQVSQITTPADPSPTVAAMRAAALGIYAAVEGGARSVEVVTSSKRVARAITGKAGGSIDDYHGSLLAGWAIHWTRDRCPDGWTVRLVEAKALPEVQEAATRLLEPPSDQGGLF